MKRIVGLFTMVIFISLSLINCSEDKVTNPNNNTNKTDYDVLVDVPATTGYPMGWEGIAPVHTVSLDAFQIGRYEVTYELWTEVKTWGDENGYSYLRVGQRGYDDSTSTNQHPVTMIGWSDCIPWCNAYSEKEGLTPVYYEDGENTTVIRRHWPLNIYVDWSADGFRLPTEAEWEYAARYIDTTNVSCGDEHSGYDLYPNIVDCAWYLSNSGSNTHPVGELYPNSLGIYDMSGNVSEWCWDVYYPYQSVSQKNSSGPNTVTRYSLRGGAFYSDSLHCRTVVHEGWYPDWGCPYYGVRVCRSDIAQ